MNAIFHAALTAIVTGNLDALRTLVEANPEIPRRRSSCGHPTLLQMVACEAHNLPDPLGAAAILIEGGAELGEPLVAAASVDARAVLLVILEQGIGVDGYSAWTPLDEAVYWSHLDLAHVLLGRGAEVNSLRVAAGLGLVEAATQFFAKGQLTPQAGPVRSPFPDTVTSDSASNAQDIVDNAFVMSAQNGQQACAAFLLEQGARMNAKPPGFHWRGTALHAAVWQGSTDMVKWLLTQGADPSMHDDMVHADAIGWARHHHHQDLVELLREHSLL